MSEEEYYYHALAHLAGAIHEEDTKEPAQIDYNLRTQDPFCYTIRSVSREMDPVGGEIQVRRQRLRLLTCGM